MTSPSDRNFAQSKNAQFFCITIDSIAKIMISNFHLSLSLLFILSNDSANFHSDNSNTSNDRLQMIQADDFLEKRIDGVSCVIKNVDNLLKKLHAGTCLSSERFHIMTEDERSFHECCMNKSKASHALPQS